MRNLTSVLVALILLAGSGPAAIITGAPRSCPRNGSLGIKVTRVEAPIAAQLGLQGRTGATITTVEPGSSGAAAGLHKFDVITHLDGRALDARAFTQRIRRLKPGTRIELRIIRQLKPRQLQAIIERYRAPKQRKRPAITGRKAARSRSSGCAARSHALGRQITSIRQQERAASNLSRRQRDQLRNLDRESESGNRHLRDLERDLIRQRSALQRQLTHLEARMAQRRNALEVKLKELSGKRQELASASLAAQGRRRELEQQRREMEQLRAQAGAQKKASNKRREIL